MPTYRISNIAQLNVSRKYLSIHLPKCGAILDGDTRGVERWLFGVDPLDRWVSIHLFGVQINLFMRRRWTII